MQYKVLIELLDSLITSKSKQAPQTFKNRPESTNIEKLKMRNQLKSENVTGTDGAAIQDEDEENYSDEEIANDPDEDEDTTNFVNNGQNRPTN